jgi:HK97 family phage prohead protease
MGDKINQLGWDLSGFRKNPTILFAHDGGSLPVGKATSVEVLNGKLQVGVRFARTPFGKSVAAMVSQGFLRATSVGFRPLDYSFAKAAGRSNGIDFHSAELLEVSIVPVPANASCLLHGITGSDGKSYDPKAERRRTLTAFKLRAALPNTAAKRKRQRELDLIKLKQPLPYRGPTTTRAQRAAEVAAIKARTR